jgi:hypothetical protein
VSEAAESPPFHHWMPTPVVDDLHQLHHGGRLYWLRINVTAELTGEESPGIPLSVPSGLGPRIADMIRASLSPDAASAAT